MKSTAGGTIFYFDVFVYNKNETIPESHVTLGEKNTAK